MPSTPKGLSEEKAARIMTGLREGRTTRKFWVSSARLEAYFTAHPEYAREARPLIAANAKAAQLRKGRDRRNNTHCKRGHSLADAYIHVSPQGWVMRNCRICHHMRINKLEPLPAKKLQQVRAMLVAQKSIADITGKWLRGTKRRVVCNSVQFYNARKADVTFDLFVKEHTAGGNERAQKLRWSLHRTRIGTAERRQEAEDYLSISALIPAHIPDPDQIVGGIIEDLLTGALKRSDVPRRIRWYVQQENKMFPTMYRKFGDSALLSLEEALFDDGSMTRADTVSRGLWD